MNNLHQRNLTRQFHPKTLKELTLQEIIGLLTVARKLREGVFTDTFDMRHHVSRCGRKRCIGGLLELEVGYNVHYQHGYTNSPLGFRLRRLFFSGCPSNPQLAANAIDRYVYDGSDNPWGLDY